MTRIMCAIAVAGFLAGFLAGCAPDTRLPFERSHPKPGLFQTTLPSAAYSAPLPPLPN